VAALNRHRRTFKELGFRLHVVLGDLTMKRLGFAALLVACLAQAEPVAVAADLGPASKEIQAVVDKASAYLKTHQGPDGSFSPQRAGPGISAVVASALLRNGFRPDDPVVSKTLTYLERSIQNDGGIYDKFLANYTTSVALMALAEANTRGQYDAVIGHATQFLRSVQYDESKVESGDAKFGGAGYDGKSRPDLSNTQYFLDALQAAGVAKGDPAWMRTPAWVRQGCTTTTTPSARQ
jgi:squalene-hopene/tetraprenyl-beta-curcumene cyclase